MELHQARPGKIFPKIGPAPNVAHASHGASRIGVIPHMGFPVRRADSAY